MRLPTLSIAVLAAVASVATAPPSAAFAQAGSGDGSPESAKSAQVETSAEAKTRLYVKRLPPGAQVTLDGKPLGASDGLFLVPAGTAKVTVQFDGAEPQVRQVEIAAGRITRVEIAAAAPAASTDTGEQFKPPRVAPRLTSPQERIKPKPLTAIDDMLKKPLGRPVDFQETSFRDAIATLRDLAAIDLLMDLRGIEDAGIDFDAAVTERVPVGAPLSAVLDMVVRDVGLAWIVRDDLIEITTPDRADERLFVPVYDVSDLAAAPGGLALLGDMIKRAIHPETWQANGGPGVIEPDAPSGAALVVSNSWRAQRRIAGLLDVLRRLKATPVEARRPLGAAGYWSDQPVVVAARAALDKAADAVFMETPLRDVTAELSKRAGVPISIDFRACEESGVDLDAAVTLAIKGGRLAVVLDRILEPMQLAVEVGDEGLVVTTPARSLDTMAVAVYPVGHLGGGDRSIGSLAELMMSQVDPTAWETVGGEAAVFPIDGDMPCLVVRQSTAGHPTRPLLIGFPGSATLTRRICGNTDSHMKTTIELPDELFIAAKK